MFRLIKIEDNHVKMEKAGLDFDYANPTVKHMMVVLEAEIMCFLRFETF